MSKAKFIGSFFLSALIWEGLKLIWKKIKYFKKGNMKTLTSKKDFSEPDQINPEIINEQKKEDPIFDFTLDGRGLDTRGKFVVLGFLIIVLLSPIGGVILGTILCIFMVDLCIAAMKFLWRSFNK